VSGKFCEDFKETGKGASGRTEEKSGSLKAAALKTYSLKERGG
jgi:hypothetical protein